MADPVAQIDAPVGAGAPAGPDLGALAAELTALEAKDPAPPAETKAEPKTEPPTDEPKIEPATPEPVEDAKDPKVATGLAAIARREKQQQDQHRTRMAELQKGQAELEAMRAQVAQFEQAKAQALRDPASFFRALGKDVKLADVAKQLYFEELGQDAPQEFKEGRAVLGVEAKLNQVLREVDELRREKVEAEQRSQHEAQWSAAVAKVEASFAKVPDSLELVKAWAEHDPKRTASAMLSMGLEWAKQHPYEAPPSDADLAQMMNEALEREHAPVLKKYRPQPNQIAKPQPQANSKTLSNATHANPTRPRAQPQTREELLKETIAELQELDRTS